MATADIRATTKTVELSLVNRAAVSPGVFKLNITQSIDNIRQVDIVEWAMTGIAVTGGLPNQSYYSLDMGALAGDATESSAEASGVKIFPLGQSDRQHYSSRTLRVTDTPFRVTPTMTFRLLRPDGRLATAADYSFFGATFRLYVDIL